MAAAAAAAGAETKTKCLFGPAPFYTSKTSNVCPRQARDKHRESTFKKRTVFLCSRGRNGGVVVQRGGGVMGPGGGGRHRGTRNSNNSGGGGGGGSRRRSRAGSGERSRDEVDFQQDHRWENDSQVCAGSSPISSSNASSISPIHPSMD